MTCKECGCEVHNWPSWLTGSALKVRCDRCSGNGFNVVSAEPVRTRVPAPYEPAEHRELVESS